MAMNLFGRAAVVGYSDPLEDGPRFVFPVYCAENGLYIAAIDGNDRITAFEQFVLSGSMLPSSTVEAAPVDDSALFAFYPGFGDVLAGSRPVLSRQIDTMLELFEDLPFVLRAIHRFARRMREAEDLLPACQDYLGKYNQFRAVQWAVSHKKSYVWIPQERPLDFTHRPRHLERPEFLDIGEKMVAPAAHSINFSMANFYDQEARSHEDTTAAADLVVNRTMMGTGQSTTLGGFVRVTALIGPRGSSVEFTACKVIASPIENLLWAAPSMPSDAAVRPILIVFMQGGARGNWLQPLFDHAVQPGVSAGIYRCIIEDILPGNEVPDLFVVLAIDLLVERYEPPLPGTGATDKGYVRRIERLVDQSKASENMLSEKSIIGSTSYATYDAILDAMRKNSPYSPPGKFADEIAASSSTRH